MATNVLVYLREESQKAALLEIAARDGYINKKGAPSISTMVQAIAKGEAVVEEAMSDEQFNALIQLMMVSDPFPLGDEAHDVLSGFANNEARKRGCHDWVDAYHTPFWNRDMVDGK